MRSILGFILAFGLALGAFAQGDVRRFNTLADLLAANPNGFATAGRATAIVSGNTNATDSWSRVLAYSSADTNAADNLTIFSPGSGVGRWRLLYLQNPTNSNVRAGIIPPWETNKFWANGAWVYLTNIFSFSAGSNITVTPSATGVSIASTAPSSSSLSFNGTTVSNPNITNSALVVWDGAGTNRFAYITNYFSWEGIKLQVPNLKDTAYIYWVPSGSDLRAYVVQGGLDLSRLEDMQPERIIGRYTPTTGVPQYIEIGSNLSLSTNGVLSAIVATSATNGTPVSVDGAFLLEANFADNSEIDFGASGTNVTASLVSGSIGTNKLSAATAALLLDSHRVNSSLVMPLVLTNNASDLGRIVYYTNGNGHVLGYATNLGAATTTVGVNGSGVSAPNLANAAEVSFTVASGTNVYAALNAGSVALSKLANAAAPSLVGRAQAGSGALETVSIGTGLNLATNGVLSATGTNLTTIRVDGTTVSGPNIQDSTELDWSVSGSTNVSASLFNSSVTLSKIQDISTSRLLGRSTSGSGSIEQILIGTGLTLSSGTLSVTGGGGGGTNASLVYVDGAAVSDPNFADSSTKFLFSVSGTNITGQLPGRDFGDITVGPAGDSMTIDADSIALGTDTTGNYVATVAGTANEVSVSGSGSETAAITLSLPATIDLGGKTSFELPNGASPTTDAFGEIAGDNNAWAAGRGAVQFFDGTASTWLVGTLASDTPSNGQVPKWNTGGTITWEDDAGSGGAGTVVTVDGGSDLARANFADASTTGIFDISGTNITFRLPDRDFGDITVSSSGAAMAINANSVALGTDTTGNYVATIAGTSNEIEVSGSGSESAATTLSLSSTVDLGGKTSFEVPNGASPTTDAFGEIAGDNNAWATGRGAVQFFDGTADTFLVGALASDTPLNGQVPTWNTGGTITWETPSAGGGSLTVNGSLVSTPNLTNSSTLLWNVSGTNISATVTNVPGSTTQNVVQKVGGVLFYNSTGTSQSNESYFGIATNVLVNAAGGGVPLQATVSLSGAASTNYVVVVEPYDANGVYSGSSAAFSVRDKTTTGFQFTADYAGAALAGTWYRVWILDTVSVGGSGGGPALVDGTEIPGVNFQSSYYAKASVASTTNVTWVPQPPATSTASSFTPAFNSTRSHEFTLNAAATLNAPSGVTSSMLGDTFKLVFIQDSTGNRTLSVATNYLFGTDITGITLSTNAGARDYVTVYVRRTDVFDVVGFVRGYAQ